MYANTTMNPDKELKFIADIPQELLDYLWDMANSLVGTGYHNASLTLRPVSMEDGLIQDVVFRYGDQQEHRKLSGFDPVWANLQVIYEEKGCVMHLVDWNNDYDELLDDTL